MRLATLVLRTIQETKIDQGAKHRYMSLPTLRKAPYKPYTHSEWDEMGRRLTEKWSRKYKTAFDVTNVHFEKQRADAMGIQLPIVERMFDLALQDRKTLGKVMKINQNYAERVGKYGVDYDAPDPRRSTDYAKRGNINIHSLSLGYWLLGSITGELPKWADEHCRQTWKLITCSDNPNFKTYQGDEIVQVEKNQGVMTLFVEIE